MPTYQYACTACDHRFEEVQKFTDPSLTECPECSGRLRKLYGSVGVVFKGSGFYRTDSRAKSSAAEKGSGDNGSGSGEKSGTESKPASSEKSSSTSSTTSTTTPTAKAS
ncbi:MAG TPA: FmdB family zinc ribbon protein [Actinophytocola sp.]|uniref:FmdB family zinc ribbon protein n=1 Tax=Actinophytocola sp. TaxID=1872138 RepID=UPI002E07BA8F|nr:FmdB family zinc ribbon protein [Actinophytocola sp.]